MAEDCRCPCVPGYVALVCLVAGGSPGGAVSEPAVTRQPLYDPEPEYDALLADSVGLALLGVLDRLTSAVRIAFVLHDMFDVSFDEIASIVGRSPTAARQLVSRARRVQGAGT